MFNSSLIYHVMNGIAILKFKNTSIVESGHALYHNADIFLLKHFEKRLSIFRCTIYNYKQCITGKQYDKLLQLQITCIKNLINLYLYARFDILLHLYARFGILLTCGKLV